jgi:hypothetical protein
VDTRSRTPRSGRRRRRPLLVAVALGLAVLAGLTAVDVSASGHADGEHLLREGSHITAAPGARDPAAHQDDRRDERSFSHRFRLGAAPDGERLRPDRRDLAARTVANGPLLLFLPATRAKPSDYAQFLRAATNTGYHVLGLDYWNLGRTLSRTCGHHPGCYTRVQRNRFDGSRVSRDSAVTPAGSIVERTRRALVHLDSADPSGGWDRFLQHGQVRWGRVVVAGHSQGGSMAAYIGHVRPVRGVLMFGAPAVSDGARHASWLDRPGQTPASRMYALGHVDDAFGPAIRPSWVSLALAGADAPPQTVATPPRGDPHILLTTVLVPPGVHAHSVVVSDQTPRDELGNPVILPLWRWMLTRFDPPATHAR